MLSHQFAAHLREIADHLDTKPNLEVGDEIRLSCTYYDADQVRNAVKVFPHPFEKRYYNYGGSSEDLWLSNDTNPIKLFFTIARHRVCRIVRPAQEAIYECEPMFKDEGVLGVEGR